MQVVGEGKLKRAGGRKARVERDVGSPVRSDNIIPANRHLRGDAGKKALNVLDAVRDAAVPVGHKTARNSQETRAVISCVRECEGAAERHIGINNRCVDAGHSSGVLGSYGDDRARRGEIGSRINSGVRVNRTDVAPVR